MGAEDELDFEIGEPVAYSRTSFKIDPSIFSDDENCHTKTSREQRRCEMSCAQLIFGLTTRYDHRTKTTTSDTSKADLGAAELLKSINKHDTTLYLLRTLMKPLSSNYSSLESSRPWLLYWTLNGLKLIGFDLDRRFYQEGLLTSEELDEKDEIAAKCLQTCMECWHEQQGGYCGNKGHLPHTAPTYAGILSLITIGTDDSFDYLLETRNQLYKFLFSLKNEESGGFRVQLDGEIDTRGLYTAICAADLCGVLTPELAKGCFNFIKRCQTYEGGFGGEPWNEAHGGYSFCAIASLVILRMNNLISQENLEEIDLEGLKEWIVHRQMSLEGGFQGRTNKLVDSCYSFWQGAIPVLYEMLISNVSMATHDSVRVGWLDYTSLIKYVTVCCQDDHGGLRDKPGKSRDQYHTAYSLSGVSVAQHYSSIEFSEMDEKIAREFGLLKIDAVYGVDIEKLKSVQTYFDSKPKLSHEQLMS